MEKQYVGDGVYVRQEQFGIVLTTENGIQVTNTIVLEPETLDSLVGILKHWNILK